MSLSGYMWLTHGHPVSEISQFYFLYLVISRIPSGHVLMCISELSNSDETALISGKCSLNKMIWWSPTLKFPVKKFYRNTSCIIILLSSTDKVLVKKTVIITYLLSLEGGGIVPYPGVDLLPFSSVIYQHLSFWNVERKSEEMIKIQDQKCISQNTLSINAFTPLQLFPALWNLIFLS